MGDIELVFYESFKAKSDAVRREKYFKTTKGTKMLKLILKDSLWIPASSSNGSGYQVLILETEGSNPSEVTIVF